MGKNNYQNDNPDDSMYLGMYGSESNNIGIHNFGHIVNSDSLLVSPDENPKKLQSPVNRVREATQSTTQPTAQPAVQPAAPVLKAKTLVSNKVKEHAHSGEIHWYGHIEKDIMDEINEKPITLTGEPTLITNCPHDCNNQGLCQRIFVKTKTGVNPDVYEYIPHYSCACKENFKGEHCNECSKGFFGKTCYPCPRNPADHIVCGLEGICDDGIEGTGRCACLDNKNDPDIFCSGIGAHSSHHEEEVLTFGFIILVMIALCCTLLLYLYHKYQSLHLFPESVAAIVFGIVVGLFIKYYYQSNNLMRILSFEPHTFFLFLLPPIMYEAGFSLKANIFFRSFMTISAYAVIATFVASLVFTLIFYFGTSITAYPFFFIEAFQFGCFISAIDPVATISIFKSLRVSEKLYMIVFGESALNDAVSIALAQSVEGVGLILEEGEQVNYFEVIMGAVSHFGLYFFGSMLVGAI